LRNPPLFADPKQGLPKLILTATLQAAEQDKTGFLAGSGMPALFADLLEAFSARGLNQIENNTSKNLAADLTRLLHAGLARAERELGHRAQVPQASKALGKLTELWLRGRLSTFDPEDPAFKDLFGQLLESAAGNPV
jgi:hypothetical protein